MPGRTRSGTYRRLHRAFGAVVCIAVFPTLANADECVARVKTSRTMPPEWSAAISELNKWLLETDNDCSEIVVQPAPDGGARFALTTRDGRRALRWMARPVELGPAVRALLVRVPESAPSEEHSLEVVAEATLPPPLPRRLELPPPAVARPQDRVEHVPLPARPTLLFSIGAGLGLPTHDETSPVGTLRAGVQLGSWELAGFARWETSRHVSDDQGPHHDSLSSVGGGLSAGRRLPVGPVILVLGTTAGLYSTRSSSDQRYGRRASVHDELLSPRAGTYAGVVFPQTGRVRVRIEVSGELALTETRLDDARLPSAPRWSSGLTVGLELGGTP